MKVLHVITNLGNGGAEAVLFRLLIEDNTTEHSVVSLMDAGVYGDRLRSAGVPVETLNMPRGRVTPGGLRRLRALIRHTEPDVVQTWMYHADLVGGTVARLAGRRAVAWGVRASDAHEHATDFAPGLLVRACALCSWIVPRRIVVNSESGAMWHRRLGYSTAKIRVIPNGYDTTRLAPNKASRDRQRQAWNIATSTKLIGMVARWDPLKDHGTLLVALQRLASEKLADEWACLLVGPDMTDSNLELVTLLRRTGVTDHVCLAGPVTDVTAAMNALDVHVLSSRSEAFPNVLAEAMACGTPCVSTDVGDARGIVGSTGWLVPARDPSALAGALRAALREMSDGPAWATRQAACRARIERQFTLPGMVAAYHAVWNETIQ